MSVGEHGDAVHVLRDLIHRVADEHDGVAALLVIGADMGEQLLASARVKSRARLVEHQHLRLHGDHARDGDAALLPAGEREGRLLQQALVQSREAGGVMHAAVQLRAGQAHVGGAEGDVAVDGLLKELVLRILEHQPHAEAHAADLLRVGPDVLAVEQHAAARRLEQAVEVLDQRRFAAARVPDEAEKLAAVNVERQVFHRAAAEGRALAVGVGQIFNTNDLVQLSCPLLRIFQSTLQWRRRTRPR